MDYEAKIKYAEEMILLSMDRPPFLFPLAPCPWCRKTAQFDINYVAKSGGTWLWTVRCDNTECLVQPRGKYVPIRKRQRFNVWTQVSKLKYIAQQWNADAPLKIIEQIQIYESAMWQQIKNYVKEMERDERRIRIERI